MAVLTIKELSKRFGKKQVLYDISMELEEGVYGLLGPNGSGKTTLMRCVCGILKYSSGTISAPKQIGYLPQRFGAFKELTVYEVLEYYASLKKIPKEKQREEIEKVLSQVNLEEKEKDKIGSLSGGMIRRLGIAQAFLGEPKLIMMDEPTAGLDPEERARFKTAVHRNQRGKCILISTHIVEDVEMLCDQVILLDQGKIRKQASTQQLKEAAKGKVYTVSEKEVLKDPFYVLKDEFIDGQLFMRVLSAEPQPGEPEEPTLEDSYMLYMKGLI